MDRQIDEQTNSQSARHAKFDSPVDAALAYIHFMVSDCFLKCIANFRSKLIYAMPDYKDRTNQQTYNLQNLTFC